MTMPTYEYRCKSCDHRFDAVQSFTDDPITECPECGGLVKKVFGSVGITFKGSGFYKTDSRAAASAKGGNGKEGSGKESGSGDTAGSGEKAGAAVELRQLLLHVVGLLEVLRLLVDLRQLVVERRFVVIVVIVVVVVVEGQERLNAVSGARCARRDRCVRRFGPV
jgi:putative FmdB family regulatory protein